MIQIDTAYTVFFPVLAAGVGVAADATPVATLWRNGSASGVTVTVSTTATTGLYKATFTTDAGWDATDHLTLSVTATIATVSNYIGVVWDSNGDVDAVMRGTNSASTHNPAAVVTALGSGSTLTACLTATGFSTHNPADVVTALGTGSTLTACLTATGFSTHDAADVLAALGTGSWATSLATQTSVDAIDDIAEAIFLDTAVTIPGLIAGISGGGSGARTVTVTIDDGTDPLQNATVRMSEGASTYTALTNASGVAVFNLDDATYTVGVSKSGYSFAGTTLVVDGAEVVTYSMTQVSVSPPGDPALSAIQVLCLDEDFVATAGVDIDFRIVTVPTGDVDKSYVGQKKTVTSDANGVARYEAPQGSVIEFKRGTVTEWQSVTVDSDSVTNVSSFIGGAS